MVDISLSSQELWLLREAVATQVAYLESSIGDIDFLISTGGSASLRDVAVQYHSDRATAVLLKAKLDKALCIGGAG